LGVNWYLNTFVRLQLNAIAWTLDNPTPAGIGTDRGESVIGRAQIAF
jgi:phosphate-selective porin OprO and OprP